MAGVGLRLGRSQGMEGYTSNLNEFAIDPANTNLIFMGDPVVMNGGYVEDFAANVDGPVAGAPIVGVFAGVRYVAANGDYEFMNHWDGGAGRTDIKAHVSQPPHQNYHVKMDATVPITQADMGTRRALIHAAGSVPYGDSRVTCGAVDAAGPVVIQRLVDLPNNTFASAEPIVEISIVAQTMTFNDAL